jgi:hypothetical protein
MIKAEFVTLAVTKIMKFKGARTSQIPAFSLLFFCQYHLGE